MDFSFCQEESQKVEFIQCAENLTRDETASCTADEAIFDTSQFTSTVPTEFHLACGSQVFLLRGNTRLSVSRSSMDSPLLYHSSVFLLALAPVDICLISTDGKQRSWSEFFSTESDFYVRRLCRAMRRLLFSEFLSKEQIKLRIWRLLSTVSFVYEIIHFMNVSKVVKSLAPKVELTREWSQILHSRSATWSCLGFRCFSRTGGNSPYSLQLWHFRFCSLGGSGQRVRDICINLASTKRRKKWWNTSSKNAG